MHGRDSVEPMGLNSLAVGPHSMQDQLAYNYGEEEDERGNMNGVE